MQFSRAKRFEKLSAHGRRFRRMFAGGPGKRIGRDRFVRNVLIAIGNSADSALLPHASRLTAEAAQWAVARLRPGGTA